jgi:pimeloyl-ACP methyl ester carboxylesterase
MVLIHGMWCTGEHLARLQALFGAHGYSCRAPTIPRDGGRGLRDNVDYLEEQCAGIAEPIVVGHSLGGLLAQLLAARISPAALVLLAPVPPRGISALSPSGVRTLSQVVLSWGFWRKPNRPSFDKFAYGIFNRLPPAEERALYPSFVHESGRVTVQALLPFLDGSGAARVPVERIGCPVFVAGAGRDRATPPAIARTVARVYDAEYREYAEMSHWMITEPGIEQVALDVADWLATLRMPASPRRNVLSPRGVYSCSL